MIYVYCDGASRGNPGPASYGVHIEDQAGTTIAEFGKGLGHQTNNYAEYQGVIAALRFLTSTQYRLVTIRLDSKLVVEQLSGRWKVKSPEIRELVFEASELLGAFDATLQWIPRDKNSIADAMANQALDDGDFQNEEAPLPLSTIQPRSIRAPRQQIEPTTIVAVRHGSTASTAAHMISGGDGEDPELNDKGLNEAQSASAAIAPLLDFFSLPPATTLIHSPMKRTIQTADAISGALGLDLVSDERLREIAFGEWDGRSMSDMEMDSSTEITKWRSSASQKPPGGESILELGSRVEDLVSEVVAGNRGKTVVLVTHMMPSRAIAKLAQRSAEATYWNVNFSPCGISVYRFFGTGLVETFTVNSCAHLIQG
jgi:probable phosphoglycerate mutase